jgi:hypothetical protein
MLATQQKMGQLINHEKAVAYLETIDDPIVRALIEHAYTQIFVGTPKDLEGEFDLLFFFKILESFLHDRESLARALAGQMDGHPFVAD